MRCELHALAGPNWRDAFDTQSKTRVARETITIWSSAAQPSPHYRNTMHNSCGCGGRSRHSSLLVIISRFELVEIIMHSSHYVVFDNDGHAAPLWRLSAIFGESHFRSVLPTDKQLSAQILDYAFRILTIFFSSTKSIRQLLQCMFAATND